MEELNNYRAKQYYSAKEAQLYPSEVPDLEAYKDYILIINEACKQHTDKIAVLELGCGTGRFFYHLSNVKKLVGIDISKNMLAVAKENLQKMPELLPCTTLTESRIEDYKPEEKFDFVYSIGTIGEYLVFDTNLLEKMVSFLKPGSLLFFTIVDIESFEDKDYTGPGKRLMRFITRLLPGKLGLKAQGKYLRNTDWKDNWMSQNQVESVLASARTPISWELFKTKDRLHVHHVCKIRPK